MRPAGVVAGTIFFLCHIMPALAQSPALVPSESESVPQILGTPRLLLHQKFKEVLPEAAPQNVQPISPGDGYATVSYSIGTDAQRQYLTEWIQYLARTLPETIGNSSGTYVVTLRIKGPDEHFDLHEPIIAIHGPGRELSCFLTKRSTT